MPAKIGPKEALLRAQREALLERNERVISKTAREKAKAKAVGRIARITLGKRGK